MANTGKARAIMRKLIKEYCEKSDTGKWSSGDFSRISRVEKGLRGDMCEDFVVNMLLYLGYDDAKRKDGHRGEYDVEANGYYIEVKSASEDVNNAFQFNGVRHNVNYDFLFLIGVSPNDIFFKIYPQNKIPKKLTPMAKNTTGTYKFTHTKEILFTIENFCDESLKYLGKPK